MNWDENRREAIFIDDEDRQFFLETPGEASEKTDCVPEPGARRAAGTGGTAADLSLEQLPYGACRTWKVVPRGTCAS